MTKAVINSKDASTMIYSVTKFEKNPNIKDTKF